MVDDGFGKTVEALFGNAVEMKVGMIEVSAIRKCNLAD